MVMQKKETKEREPIGETFKTLIALVHFLREKPRRRLSVHVALGVSERSFYRHVQMLEALGVPVEKDFNNRYFIPEHTCPLCGKQPATTTTNDSSAERT
jgi:hypothetical protein